MLRTCILFQKIMKHITIIYWEEVIFKSCKLHNGKELSYTQNDTRKQEQDISYVVKTLTV